jgi:pimeloyl-ACP methyl ester carboxylesterase
MKSTRRFTQALQHTVLPAAVLAVTLAGTAAVALGEGNDSRRDFGGSQRDDGDYVKLASQGFFFVNGRYFTDEGPELLGPGATGPGGQRMVEQMYVEYQIPKDVKHRYPLVMIHGGSQTGVNFKGTPDGREGWGTYFLRQGYAVYIVDQVGRGRSPAYNPLPPNPEVYGTPFARPANTLTRMQNWTRPEDYNLWHNAHLHTQWPGTGMPGDGPFDEFFASQIQSRLDPGGIATQTDAQQAGAALLDRIGPAIVMTHSQSGVFGFLMADARPRLVKAVVTIEGGGVPYATPLVGPLLGPATYGSGFPTPSALWGIVSIPITYSPAVNDPNQLMFVQEAAPDTMLNPNAGIAGIRCWLQAEPARQLPNLKSAKHLLIAGEAASAANVNHCVSKYLTQAGVENTWVNLGTVGIHGNGHMMMWEKNNLEIAAFIGGWLKDNVEKGKGDRHRHDRDDDKSKKHDDDKSRKHDNDKSRKQ